MLVLGSEILLLSILYVFLQKASKKNYYFIAAIVLTIFAALRSSSVGPDGLVYAQAFKDVQSLSYSEIFVVYTKEPIFYATLKLLQEIGVTLQIWYALIGGLFAFAVMYATKLYSEQPLVSVLALFSLGYYTFSFTGLRQTVALSIIILCFCMIEQKKYWIAILLILVASLYHNSALIFLLIVFVRDRRIKIWQYVMFMLASLVGVMVFEAEVYAFISDIVDSVERLESYAGYTYGLSWAGFIIQLLIFIFCMVLYNGKNKQLLLNTSFFGVLFQMLTVLLAEFFRISMYFSIVNILLIGNVYCQNRFTTRSKHIARILLVAALILYFINSHTGYEYSFYWQ